MNIRPAVVADAHAIAAVHVRSWQAAYAHLLCADFLASLSIGQRAQRWADILQAAESATAVAELAGTVQAFVSFGRCRDEQAPEQRGEIWALYASPDAWGQGLGRSLLAHALGALNAQGFRETSLWVLSGNERGVRFYRCAGFAPVAGSPKLFTLGGTQIEETQFLLQHAA
jgi:ribosomal protein S18 acetylase RimI-like enzyme